MYVYVHAYIHEPQITSCRERGVASFMVSFPHACCYLKDPLHTTCPGICNQTDYFVSCTQALVQKGTLTQKKPNTYSNLHMVVNPRLIWPFTLVMNKEPNLTASKKSHEQSTSDASQSKANRCLSVTLTTFFLIFPTPKYLALTTCNSFSEMTGSSGSGSPARARRSRSRSWSLSLSRSISRWLRWPRRSASLSLRRSFCICSRILRASSCVFSRSRRSSYMHIHTYTQTCTETDMVRNMGLCVCKHVCI